MNESSTDPPAVPPVVPTQPPSTTDPMAAANYAT